MATAIRTRTSIPDFSEGCFGVDEWSLPKGKLSLGVCKRFVLNRSYVFRSALAAEFGEEIVLLQACATAQKIKKRVFHFVNRFIAGAHWMRSGIFELTEIGDQCAR
jgi:hypothetical protein